MYDESPRNSSVNDENVESDLTHVKSSPTSTSLNQPVEPHITDTRPHVDFVHRRSTRHAQQPLRLRDYHCYLADTNRNAMLVLTSTHVLYSVLGYAHLSPSYKMFALFVSVHSELQFYHIAAKHEHWKHAMDEEIEALCIRTTLGQWSFYQQQLVVDGCIRTN